MAGQSEIRRPSPAVIAAVRDSCRAVASRPVSLAEAFYEHLFEMAPGVRAMFPPDLTDQMQKMTDALLGAIAMLAEEDTEQLEAMLRELGAVHGAHYGVVTEHYMYVGHALTRAVRDVAGPSYSGSLSSSWIALYQWIAAHMIDGAEAGLPDVQAQPAEPTPVPLPGPREPREDEAGSVRFPAWDRAES